MSFLLFVTLLLSGATQSQRVSDFHHPNPIQFYWGMFNPQPDFLPFPFFSNFNEPPPVKEEPFFLSNSISPYPPYPEPPMALHYEKPYSFPPYPMYEPPKAIKRPFDKQRFFRKWKQQQQRRTYDTRGWKNLRRLKNKALHRKKKPSQNIPGKPGKDYPVYDKVPPTRFNCSQQGYKGPHADMDTRCQVWHYCELDGRQHSFLCPNGTVFSQSAYVCDWWHKVDCAASKQQYVLNERLYKYIKPIPPKFPFDFQGPLVDLYIYLKYMEKLRKKGKDRSTVKKSTPPQYHTYNTPLLGRPPRIANTGFL